MNLVLEQDMKVERILTQPDYIPHGYRPGMYGVNPYGITGGVVYGPSYGARPSVEVPPSTGYGYNSRYSPRH